MMTLTWTDDAESDLGRYLERVKAALRGHPSVDADEVECDIRGHIEAELADAETPVTASRLRSVLDRLGSPTQWVPAEELPAWRRFMLTLYSGPGDWRGAYATFGLLVLGPILGPIGPPFAFASIVVARATLAVLRERDEPVGARAWLIYPSLLFFYAGLIVAVLVMPIGLAGAVSEQAGNATVSTWVPEPFWAGLVSATALATGVWWTAIGLLCGRFTAAVQFVFRPFADQFARRHARRIVLAGVAIAALGGVTLTTLLP